MGISQHQREEPAAMVSVQALGLWDSKWQVPYVQTNPSYSEKIAEHFPWNLMGSMRTLCPYLLDAQGSYRGPIRSLGHPGSLATRMVDSGLSCGRIGTLISGQKWDLYNMI